MSSSMYVGACAAPCPGTTDNYKENLPINLHTTTSLHTEHYWSLAYTTVAFQKDEKCNVEAFINNKGL